MSAKKIVLIVTVVLVLAAIVTFTVVRSQSGQTKVITAKVQRQDLVTVVSGTGQIKPKTYVNIGATAFGRITHLYVKEGDTVKRGQQLASIENIQAVSGVDAQQAAISSSKTDIGSYSAAENVAQANLEHAKADLEQKQLDFDRAKSLYDSALISKQDYDAKKAALDLAVATKAQMIAGITQSKAQTDSARGKLAQNVATLRSNYDSLNKTVSAAPFDGIVTNLPVREGETAVVGIQNAQGSTLMTLADMSIITAEVKVDETDIVNVKLGQPAEVTVDAVPGKTYKGHVTEVGDQALLRSSGLATSQSTSGSEEAKDFKVVVTIDEPSGDLRPGLSTTAKITTAKKDSTLAIPIQALTMRDPAAEKARSNGQKSGTTVSAATAAAAKPAKKAAPVQGVYMLKASGRNAKAEFVPVSTGITGATDIEVTNGLKEGDEIVIGSYKVLKSLKSGTAVKRDTSPQTKPEGDSSSS